MKLKSFTWLHVSLVVAGVLFLNSCKPKDTRLPVASYNRTDASSLTPNAETDTTAMANTTMPADTMHSGRTTPMNRKGKITMALPAVDRSSAMKTDNMNCVKNQANFDIFYGFGEQ